MGARTLLTLEGAPDLAAEIPSPSDTPAALLRKTSQHLAAGARIVRAVYGEAQGLPVFENSRTLKVGALFA